MRKFLTCAVAAASVAAITAIVGVGPAAAQVAGARTAANLATSPSPVTEVQWRRGPGWRGGWRPGWGCRWGCGWRGRGGWWVPGAVIGGAVVGSAIAAGAYGPYGYGPYAYPAGAYPAEAGPDEREATDAGPADGDSTAYCMQRYHSYNPRTGTYLGYDGRRHSCP